MLQKSLEDDGYARLGRILPDRQRLLEFCRKWKIIELSFFGSVLRSDFLPESDIDVLVSFAPSHQWSIFDRIALKEELSKIFGRKADVVHRAALERSSNWIRKQAILKSAIPYVQR